MKNPSSRAISYFQQATTCFQNARYVESIQHYLMGLKYDKGRHYVYADIAKAYEMIGNWEQALKYLNIALQLSPNSTTALRRKARISEEKRFYESIISEIDLNSSLPSEFANTIHVDNQHTSRIEVEYRFFKLYLEPAVLPHTLWNICQLIDKTYTDVGTYLDCFPSQQVSISIVNTHSVSSEGYLPQWAGGAYDGHIHLRYCTDEEPELGVLYTLFRHEWTHLLIDILTQGNCPHWLNEGLAQTIARPLFTFEKSSLDQAEKDNSLPTLIELDKPITELTNSQRKIWYLQSAAIVADMIDKGGFSSIQKLLSLLGNGKPITAALQEAYPGNVSPNMTD